MTHYWPFVQGIHQSLDAFHFTDPLCREFTSYWMPSTLLTLCAGNSPVTGCLPHYWPFVQGIHQSLDAFHITDSLCREIHQSLDDFHITDSLCRESTSHWWIPPKRAVIQNFGVVFFWVWISCWADSKVASDPRHDDQNLTSMLWRELVWTMD